MKIPERSDWSDSDSHGKISYGYSVLPCVYMSGYELIFDSMIQWLIHGFHRNPLFWVCQELAKFTSVQAAAARNLLQLSTA